VIPVEIRAERVYVSPRLSISIQRAEYLRAFEKEPPHNLGALPLHRVSDYSQVLPATWDKEAGIFVPLLPDEALWLGFSGTSERPNAVRIYLDDINAVTGKPSPPDFHPSMQDYLVCPPQLHWDGARTGGTVEPFAAPLLTRNPGIFKTLRVMVYEPLPGISFRKRELPARGIPVPLQSASRDSASQEFPAVIADPYGRETWDERSGRTLCVQFVEPVLYASVTGKAAPQPADRKAVFTRYRLP
jgi:hypothetical protein